MKYNEAQQKEQIANGVGSLSLSLEVLVLIALAKLAGPILAIVWVGLCVWGAVLHYRNVTALAEPPVGTWWDTDEAGPAATEARIAKIKGTK